MTRVRWDRLTPAAAATSASVRRRTNNTLRYLCPSQGRSGGMGPALPLRQLMAYLTPTTSPPRYNRKATYRRETGDWPFLRFLRQNRLYRRETALDRPGSLGVETPRNYSLGSLAQSLLFLVGMNRALPGAFLLCLSACGASPWLTGIKVAEKVQETASAAMAAEQDALLKGGDFLCVGWTHRYTAQAQQVLALRGREATGDAAAVAGLSKAQAAATDLEAAYEDYCALAKKTTTRLKGLTLPPYASSPALAPALSPPATIAPTGAVTSPSLAPGGLPPSVPVGASSPVVTPPVVVPQPGTPQ